MKEEYEPDWGGDDPATPGTSPGTPPRTQPGCWDDAPYWIAGRLFLDEVDDDQNGEMTHWNIETGSQQQVWPSEMSEKAISFKGSDGAHVAVLVREFALDHMQECKASDVIDKIFLNGLVLQEARAYERRHRGSNRKYDEHLRVTNGYHKKKRDYMARLGYTPTQIEEEEGSPDPTEYVKMVHENEGHLARFNARIFYVAKFKEDDWLCVSEEQQKITLLLRLLRLSHDIMGKRAVSHISNALAYWKAKADGIWIPGYQPQTVYMPLTFAEMQEAQGWITIPEHQRGKETLGPSASIGNIIFRLPVP